MQPRFEIFADWSVAVAGTTLPVHSQIIASASTVLCDMLQDNLLPKSPITLPGPSEITMTEVLALLRFIYDGKSITKENIHFLSIHNDLEGVLRLADSIDCCQLLEDCKVLVNNVLLDWPPTEAGPSSAAAAKNAVLEFNHVKAMMGFATNVKDTVFNEACYTYVAKRCNAITANATKAASVKDAVSLVRQLGDYPGLLRAGLLFALCRNSKYTGKTILRVVDNDLGENFKGFPFVYKFQITGSPMFRDIVAMADPKHADFNWNGHQFNLNIIRLEAGDFLSLKLDLGYEPPGPQVDVTFRFFNWTNPSKSLYKVTSCNFEERNYKIHCLDIKTDVQDSSFLDEDGVLYVSVVDWKVTADATNPPQNNN